MLCGVLVLLVVVCVMCGMISCVCFRAWLGVCMQWLICSDIACVASWCLF